MAIVKYNNYIAPHDVVNLSNNVPYDIIGKDQSSISVNFSVSPAEVTIKKGSLIEHNNDYYLIDSDETFTMSNAGHEYIGFNGSSFSSIANIGSYDYDKIGFYNGNYRVLKYYIHQADGWYNNLFEIQIGDEHFRSIQHDHIKVGLSGNFQPVLWQIIPFDTVYFDDLGSWDSVNYKFIVINSGYYIIGLHVNPYTNIEAPYNQFMGAIRINSVDMLRILGWYTDYSEYNHGASIFYLHNGDVVEFYAYQGDRLIAGENDTFAFIAKLL